MGIGTVVAPFLLMQPCMGAGIAASRIPLRPDSTASSPMGCSAWGCIALAGRCKAFEPRFWINPALTPLRHQPGEGQGPEGTKRGL
ncbi:DUF2938 family protein [Aeromonas mytilicola]